MIVRLVKMTFRPEEVERFQGMFERWKGKIIGFPGCLALELLHDTENPCVFFTHSHWRSFADLEAYRHSAVFGDVWPVVKTLFAAPPEAWSTHSEHRLPEHKSPISQSPA
ncbi:MAG: antibiotic biosynthesis monooxygenase [Flavobacteriales bacterium]|jgi:heme-degrading monooxygenase HmoA|nr:antibiotic biosynthesis monooxygenase [Flavobacteriales bacterium]